MEQSEKSLPPIDLVALLGDIRPVIRQFWLIGLILVVLLTAVFGIWEAKTYDPLYEASASFTVKVVNPLYASANGYNAETAEQMEKTFPYILSSNALREYVKEHLGIMALPYVKADVIDGTNVFTLRVRDSDPKQAHDVLNAVITCYPEVSEFVLGPTVMVLLDQSGVPTQPINSLSVPAAVVKGAILGFALWIAMIVLVALSRNTVHNEDELKQMLNCPCLGAIPTMKVVGRDVSCPMVTQEHGKQGFVDAMQLVHLHLEPELKKHGHRVILVSSAVPGEGKTTISSNLAITLAQKGKRVLLIDCDLRNPSVAQAFQTNNQKGLADFLNGTLTVKDMIKGTRVKNLYLVTGGYGSKRNLADQVSGERFSRMMIAVRRIFDYIILDTSPCGLLADASEVAERADCAVMVVRYDHASRSQVLDGARFLTDSKLPLIGSVLNGAKSNSRDGYGYGYGYGYGKKKTLS